MLLTLLSPFLGILGSLLPSIVRIFEMKQQMAYDLAINKMKMEAAVQNANIQIAIEDAKADIADAESVRSYDNNIDGGKFINALRASIRPVITYIFFAVFILIKLVVLSVMIDQGASMMDLVKTIWDQDTMALFGAIIGFWFGTRMIEKAGYAGIKYGRILTVSSLDPAKPISKSTSTKNTK